MTRLRLTPADRRDLLDLVRRSPEPAVRLRSHLLVLLADGHPWVTVAAALFCSTSTIARWMGRFEAGGVDAVLGRPRGRKRSGVHVWAGLVGRWVLALSP